MAPLSLNCPLCCSQTFASHTSLKNHLLNIIDNLLCPVCNKKCADIHDLTEHLGMECQKTAKNALTSTNQNEEKINKTIATKEPDRKQLDQPKVKKEPEENSSENGEIEPDHIIDIDEQGNVNEGPISGEESMQGDPNMMYTCQMCNVSFNSVQEHLAKYHEGEEVLLETEADEESENPMDDSLYVYQDDLPDTDDQFEEATESTTDGSKRVNSGGHTDSYTDMVDNDGTPHKIKVVRADNDWMEGSDKQKPVTEKYIVDGAKVKKITEEEASQIKDKSSIIEIHSCPNCLLQFPNISHYKKHKCTQAARLQNRKTKYVKIKEELKYQCTFCEAVYSSLVALNDHMKKHLVQDDSGMVLKKTVTMTLHVCEVCNTKFPSFKQLRLHSRMHDPVKSKTVDSPVGYSIMGPKDDDQEKNKEQETFQCPVCEKFYDKEYEEVHLKSHDGLEEHLCFVCNRKFDTKANLEMHMKAHSNTKKFACSYCKKPFTNYPALEDHVMNLCTKRPYECQYCGRRFARPHEKVKHERIHTGEKPHVCQVCGKAFRVSYCLTLHMRTHSGVRPYTCNHCSKRFKSHSVFNHHMLTHSEERNYKCTFCPKAFKTAVQLAGHKNSHTKPFNCTVCNRPFSSLYAVRAHMETHNRDNNLKFDCWLCGASYARSFALKDHMNAAHGDGSITDGQGDDNILLELENVTGENATENESEMEQQDPDVAREDQHETEDDEAAEHENREEENEEGYVVLQSGHEESNEHYMEVVEAQA